MDEPWKHCAQWNKSDAYYIIPFTSATENEKIDRDRIVFNCGNGVLLSNRYRVLFGMMETSGKSDAGCTALWMYLMNYMLKSG